MNKKFLSFFSHKLINLILRFLPYSKMGDSAFSALKFFKVHQRFPDRRLWLSDFIFWSKVGSESKNVLRAFVTDKDYLKLYVQAKLGEGYSLPTLAVLRNTSEITEYNFPTRCCIKPTHLSGEVILRLNGENLDKALIERWMLENHYLKGREYNYKFLTPKIIVEPLIFDSSENEDFKFFCFEGQVKFVQVDLGRFVNHQRAYLTRDGCPLNFSILKPKWEGNLVLPSNWVAMVAVAESLAEDFNFIRVDLYSDNVTVLVGELTSWPENGFGYFIPRDSEEYASNILFSVEDKGTL